jgi:hypothetical protein
MRDFNGAKILWGWTILEVVYYTSILVAFGIILIHCYNYRVAPTLNYVYVTGTYSSAIDIVNESTGRHKLLGVAYTLSRIHKLDGCGSTGRYVIVYKKAFF